MPIVIDGKTFETFTEAVNHVKKTKPRLVSPEKYVSRIQKKQRNAQLTAIKIRISRIVGRPKTQRDRLNEANSYAKEIGKRIGRGEEHIPNVQDELAGLTKYVTDGTKIRPPKPTQKDRKKIISAKQKTAVSALSSVGNTTANLRRFHGDEKFENNVKRIMIRDMDSIRPFLLRSGTANSFVLGDLLARKIGDQNEDDFGHVIKVNHGGYLPQSETNLTYGNGVIVKMHPQKFLDLATELGTMMNEKSYQSIMEGYKKGRPMGIPSFTVDGKNQITSHEGRHRATAARDFGLKEIPVLIERSKNMYPPFTDEEAAAIKTLKPLKSERLYGYQKNAGINLPDDYEKREKRYDERNKKIKNPKKFDWKKHEVQGFRQKTDELMSALTEDKLKRVRSSPLLEDQTMRIEHGDELTGRGLISEEEAIKGARIECPKTNLAKLKNRLVERLYGNQKIAYQGGSKYDQAITNLQKEFQSAETREKIIGRDPDYTTVKSKNEFGHECGNEATCGATSRYIARRLVSRHNLNHTQLKIEGGYYKGDGAEFSSGAHKDENNNTRVIHEWVRLDDGTIIDGSAGQFMDPKNPIRQEQRLRVIPPDAPLQKNYETHYTKHPLSRTTVDERLYDTATPTGKKKWLNPQSELKKHIDDYKRAEEEYWWSTVTEDEIKQLIDSKKHRKKKGLISEEGATKGASINCPKTNLAKLKTRMDEIKTAKEHKHTIQFRQAKRMGEVGEFRGATQGKYWKYWLLNAKQTNGNGWGVSSDSIDSNIAKFIGRPFCVTAKQWFPESEYETYEHPYLPTNNLDVIFNHQAKYSVGEIVDVMKNDDGDYYAMIRPHSKFANHSPPAFCSPAIFQLDPSEPENKISKWEALHLAGLDRDPAYGAQIALLKGTCVGTVNECKVQFKSAKQEKYDSDYIDAKRFAAYKLNAPAEVRINPEHGEKIANAYEQMKHEPNNPNVKAAYGALIDETGKQFKDLIGDGLKITKLKPNEPNPYSTSKHMHEDIEKNNHIYYFPTESGFGQGEKNPDHPMLQPTEFKDADQPLLANDVFRIVHDVNGHYVGGKTTFGPKGEHQAYLQHSRMYSPLAKKALFTETVGQNNWVNFGPYGTKNRSDPKNTVFAEQKAGLLPDEIVNGRFHI